MSSSGSWYCGGTTGRGCCACPGGISGCDSGPGDMEACESGPEGGPNGRSVLNCGDAGGYMGGCTCPDRGCEGSADRGGGVETAGFCSYCHREPEMGWSCSYCQP